MYLRQSVSLLKTRRGWVSTGRDKKYEHKQLKYYSFCGQLLTNVSVVQRLVQGQDTAVG